ncbi:hypothetical protein SK854_04585 [Lentzea sp. BCCO 10_0061]|uniref:Uncharacterized protein n=1 Tax=Lentzea sokolovensis TaxID=3095429 RepID=A0ABU4URE2_9PSEU|nr:hypothetical protein [Lentzea sp. BCCO 10_0061]MDX8141378.1 hypothetical protein [Lentzea sp. BCCO 10_0061]
MRATASTVTPSGFEDSLDESVPQVCLSSYEMSDNGVLLGLAPEPEDDESTSV